MNLLETMTGNVANAHEKADKILQELENQSEELATIADNFRSAQQRRQFTRMPLQGVADATGVCTIVKQVPVGMSWDMVSLSASGGPAGGCFVYLNTNEPINLIRVLNYGQRMSDDFNEDENIPGGQNIVVEFTGQPIGQICTVNLKVSVNHG